MHILKILGACFFQGFCSAAGSATLTVNGLDGAAPERLDPTEPPFTTPNEPSVALELRVLLLPLLSKLS